MARPRLLIIGSTNTDMVVEVPTLPHPGQTVLGGAFRMFPGGKGANQAVAAARAGGDITFITAVGSDSFGAENRRRFAQEGIDMRFLAEKDAAPSGVALILVDQHGENVIAVAPGANGQLLPADLAPARDAFRQADLLVVQLEIPLETVQWAVQAAVEAGCPVLLNPAPMPAGGLSDALLRQIDVLTPNVGELRALAVAAPTVEAAAHAVLARGVKAVVVTEGRHGATVYTRDETLHVPAFPVQAVDTVGAGDCFSATLGVALAERRPLREAVRFAAAAAAISTTVPGAQEGMPTRLTIDQMLQ